MLNEIERSDQESTNHNARFVAWKSRYITIFLVPLCKGWWDYTSCSLPQNAKYNMEGNTVSRFDYKMIHLEIKQHNTGAKKLFKINSFHAIFEKSAQRRKSQSRASQRIIGLAHLFPCSQYTYVISTNIGLILVTLLLCTRRRVSNPLVLFHKHSALKKTTKIKFPKRTVIIYRLMKRWP